MPQSYDYWDDSRQDASQTPFGQGQPYLQQAQPQSQATSQPSQWRPVEGQLPQAVQQDAWAQAQVQQPGWAQPQLQIQPEAEAQLQAQVESEMRAQAPAQQVQPQAQVQQVQQVQLQPQAQAQNQAQMQAQPLLQPQPQSQAQPQPQTQPQPQSQAQPQPQPQVQPQQAQPQAPAQAEPKARKSRGKRSKHADQPPASQSSAQQFQTFNAAAQGAPQIAYVPVQQVPQKRGRGWIVALVVIVCLFAFTAFCVKSCTDVMVSAGAYGIDAGPAGDAIAVIDIDGTIQYDDTACSPEGLKELLDAAEENSKIKGVVLRVNSGGGTATAGEEMAEYVRQFSKPIVVSSASINASAAYEISSQANYIYVAKSTEIGSIGTAMETTDLSGLLDMLGVDIEVITSADSKDSSYGYRPLTDEEREYYQNMINQINDIFIENVAQGRSMEIDEVRALATGLVFTGIDAVENGLADEIGTLEDAVDKAASLAGVSDYTTYDLSAANYDISSLYYLLGGSGKESSQLNIPALKQ